MARPTSAAIPESTSYRAGIAARVELLFDETKADLRHTEEFECVVVGLGETFDADEIVAVDYDDRDLREAAPDRAAYQLTDAPIDNKTYFSGVEKAIKDKLYRDQTLTLRRTPTLKLYSRPGRVGEADFAARCEAAADAKADADAAKLRKPLEAKMARCRRRSSASRSASPSSSPRPPTPSSTRSSRLPATSWARCSAARSRPSRSSARSRACRLDASSRRPPADRVESALAKVEQKEMELADLEAELADAIADIAAEWDAKAAEVEELEVGLEKTDISVTQLALIWVPV